MENVLKLHTENKYLKIELHRELNTDDLAPVTVKENSISFILSLANQCNWEFKTADKYVEATLNIRFLHAPALKDKISELIKIDELGNDMTVKMFLMDLVKVHQKVIKKDYSFKGCKTPEQREQRKDDTKQELTELANQIEQGFYNEVAQVINKSVKMINEIYTQKNLIKNR